MEDYPICSAHFDDPYIVSFIENSENLEVCDYCQIERKCILISGLADLMIEGVETEYVEPYEAGAWYDKEATFYEDRFLGVSVSSTEEILQDEFSIDEWDLANDLAQYFDHEYLTKKALHWPEEHERLMYGWSEFKEIIKHKMRFVFFRNEHERNFEDTNSEAINPFFILDEVGSAINGLNLIAQFSVGSLRVFRMRQHEYDEEVGTARELGSPPKSIAKDNRMSPAGISMFYGAFDNKTCYQEIVDEDWAYSKVTWGKFINQKELRLIDFTKFKGVPSLLDKRNRGRRAAAKFIQSFLWDMATPVTPSDKIRLDYIPTQVVSEYFRFVPFNREPIDGLIYQSVKNTAGKCVVLFVDNQQIQDGAIDLSDVDTNIYLKLDTSSVATELVTKNEQQQETFLDWIIKKVKDIFPLLC